MNEVEWGCIKTSRAKNEAHATWETISEPGTGYVSADSRILSGRNQNFVSLLLISTSSRPNLLCFGFDLNQSQRTIPISRNGYVPDCSVSLNQFFEGAIFGFSAERS